MTKLSGSLSIQVEYTSPDIPEGRRAYCIGNPENVKRIIEEQGATIKRVLLRERTPQQAQYLQMWIREDMHGHYLQQEMNDDPMTTNLN